MNTSIESRLWLAVHLLYPNSSQAFDVYQAVVLQSEEALVKNQCDVVFSKLLSVFEKISVISSNLSFYEFEYEQIDQWKVLYKYSQKQQLIIFIGVLIFELKVNVIARYVKLAPAKAQFLFHQMFKKLAQSSVSIKFSDKLNFKKHNDIKISYLYTYENLIEYCLGQLPQIEAEKVKIGLNLYPVLQTTQQEYLKIINQIQSLKVLRLNSVLNESKIKLVKSESTTENSVENKALKINSTNRKALELFYKHKIQWLTLGALAIVISALAQLLVQFSDIKYFFNSDKSIVLQQIQKSTPVLTGTLAEEIAADRTFVSRREVAEHAGASGRAHALGAEEVLDPERRAFEWPCFALSALGIGRLRAFARQFGRRDDESVQMRIGFVDRGNERVGKFDGGELLLLHAVERLGEG